MLWRVEGDSLSQARLGLVSAYLLQNRLNMINDYIQIMSKEFELDRGAQNPSDIIKSVKACIQNFVEEKQIGIEVNIEDTVPGLFFGDRRRLETILFHLLWNAGKYSQFDTPHFNHGSLTIGAMKKLNAIAFYVSDNGIGISDEKKRKLFRFVSREVHSTIKRRSSRRQMLCGLGLTICQMICKEMGTKLHVNSQEGIGSTFSFEIPLQASSIKLMAENEEIESDYYSEGMEEHKADIQLPTYDCQGSRLLPVKQNPNNRKEKLKVFK